MDDTPTHRITVTVVGRYQHGKEAEHATVTVAGAGDSEHFLDAFRAALVAAGFSTDLAGSLTMTEAL